MQMRAAYIAGLFGLVTAAAGAPVFAQADENAPLSAIDWLSETIEQPEVISAPPSNPPAVNPRATQSTRTPPAGEAPVTQSAVTPPVTVQPLGAPAPRSIGLLSPQTTGLPATLWRGSDFETLATLLMAEQVDTLPALQDLILTLAMAEAAPPLPTSAEHARTGDPFLLARIDKLLDFGALEPALAMLEAADQVDAQVFRRRFDVALLSGAEDAACRALQNAPDIAPTPAARVFCLARSGDWSAAALTLNTGRALGDIDTATSALLARFLDPDLFEAEPPLDRPSPMTPLTFRMMEAIGDPQNTQGLPRAFSHADLRANVGWKAQLEAAERLARSGAIAENTLVGLYTGRVPSASGGVWERAKAVIALDKALTEGDSEAIAEALQTLWDETYRRGLTVPLAQYFAPRLIEAEVPAQAARTLFHVLLLSDLYETAAQIPALAQTNPFLAALAQGDRRTRCPCAPPIPYSEKPLLLRQTQH